MTDAQDKPRVMTLPWFQPLYRRVLVCMVPVIGLLFEFFVSRDQFWMVVWVAVLIYGVWTFFINFDREIERLKNAEPKD